MGQTYSVTTAALSANGERRRYVFWCPSPEGYIHLVTPERPGTSGPQVCERLYLSGPTLYGRPETLKAIIRRELRRRRDSLRREQAQWS